MYIYIYLTLKTFVFQKICFNEGFLIAPYSNITSPRFGTVDKYEQIGLLQRFALILFPALCAYICKKV